MSWRDRLRLQAAAVPDAASGRQMPPRVKQVDQAWAELWFMLERYAWSTLAVLPVRSGTDALGMAWGIASAGWLYRGGSVEIIDGTNAEPDTAADILLTAPALVAGGRKVVIPTDSPLTNPAAIAIARVADAVVLAVPLGTSKLADARRAIESVGRERFIGSIVMPQVTEREAGVRQGLETSSPLRDRLQHLLHREIG